jgi:hypothetical protein
MDSAQNEDVPDGSKYNLHNQVPLDRDGLWDTSSDFIDTVDDMPSMPQIGKNPGRSRKGGLVGSIEQTAENLTAIPELLDEVAQFGKKGLVAGGGTVMAIANKFIVEPVFGKDKVLADKFNVDPKKGITAKASKADLSKPENVGELVKVKEAMTKSKVVTPPTEEQIKISEANYSEQMERINTKYKGIRRKSEAVSNLYLTGLIDEKQLRNFSESGDMRYSGKEKSDYALKTQKDKLAYDTAKVKYDTALDVWDKRNDVDPEEKRKQMGHFQTAQTDLSTKAYEAMGLYDRPKLKTLTTAVAQYTIANNLAMNHIGFDPNAMNDFRTAGTVAKHAQMHYRMNQGKIKYDTTLPAMAAIQKGFAPEKAQEFSEAFNVIASKSNEIEAFEIIKGTDKKGQDLLDLMYAVGNKM